MSKLFILSGSILAFFAVGFGAFGAHGLKSKISAELMETFQTGIQYQMYHALGLILIGLIVQRLENALLLNWAGIMILIGILLFSGSLYILSILGARGFGIITPFGGVCFLIGWLLLAFQVLKSM